MKFLCVCIVATAAMFHPGVDAQDPAPTPFPPALTSFTCHGRPPGYYADVETGCRTYHVCDGISQFTYVCPRRTLFQQSTRICDHAHRVRCQDSPYFYEEDYDDDDGDGEEEGATRLPPSEDRTISSKDFSYAGEEYNPVEDFFSTTETTTEDDGGVATVPATPRTQITTTGTVNSVEVKSVGKFLRFHVKDVRSLFFIPEFGNNSIVAQPEREFVLPVEKNDSLSFKEGAREGRSSSSSPPCPAYCNPKFFLRGTCHPCITIK